MKKNRQKRGFILVELVAVIILVGIIGSFTALFLYTGILGYLRSKGTSESALLAQTTLERISKELRDVKELPVNPVTDTSITYTSHTLPGQRSISYSNGVISITVGGTSYPLLDNVSSFSLNWDQADLNDDGNNDLSGITIGFTAGEIQTPFSTTIFPRAFLPAPP